MIATLNDQTGRKKRPEPSAEAKAAAELVRAAKEQGLSLTGPDGLLKQLTKTVLETALNEEMTEHLGYEKHDQAGAGSGNIRNGTRSKTVLTDTTGPVQIDVPRDRAGTFEPQIVRKRQRRLSGVDEVVLSLYAKGLTTGEISAHFAEIYGASVSKETISRITDKVIEEMTDWSHRPLDAIYAAVFIDAIVVKVRDGQVANRPFYAAIGVTLDGEKDILGLWAGAGGEGSYHWMMCLGESETVRARGPDDSLLPPAPGEVGRAWGCLPARRVGSCRGAPDCRRRGPGQWSGVCWSRWWRRVSAKPSAVASWSRSAVTRVVAMVWNMPSRSSRAGRSCGSAVGRASRTWSRSRISSRVKPRGFIRLTTARRSRSGSV